MQGMVSHHGALGCVFYCSLPGRHKGNSGHYYSVLRKPFRDLPAGCNHQDINLNEIPPPSAAMYEANVARILATTTERQYQQVQKATSISKFWSLVYHTAPWLLLDGLNAWRGPQLFQLAVGSLTRND